MAIRNDTDDNLVAEWQGVEVPNELQAPAHERASLLVRDGKLVAGLSTEPGLFVSHLELSAKLQESELQELLGERIASVYRREMLAVAGFSDPAIGRFPGGSAAHYWDEIREDFASGFPGGSAAHYWDRIREDFASMSKHVLFEKGDAAIEHAVRRLGADQLDGFMRLLLILSALRLDGRLDERTIRGLLSYHVANADYPVWRTIAMELLEPLTLAQTADIRMERRRLLHELQPLADDAIRQELIQLANLPELYKELNTHNLLRGMAPRGRGKYAWSYLLDGLNLPWLDWIQLVRYRLAHLENYANYKEARCLMWPHMKKLRKDLRQIYGTRN